MRIGLVIYGSLDTVTGGYLYDRKLVEHLRTRGDEACVQHGKNGLATLRLTPRDAPRQGALGWAQGTTAEHHRVLELDTETLLVQLTRPEARDGRMAQRSSCSIAAVAR
jgi:hypothetical protein